jgi:single-stranded-DNA-specific exonuclease
MNQNKKLWQQYRPDPNLSSRISKSLGVSPITAQVLINRGIDSAEVAKTFLEPKLNNLSDPMGIPNIAKAAGRVLLAKERGESVAVYGDYDVDGVTGTVILLEILNFLGIKSTFYIPHRYQEGYGLNNDAIKGLKNDGVNLLVTVDCGVSNKEEIDLANSLGMDVVVTDHHNPPESLPEAVAIVNPKLGERDHPSYDLSGAGVAFKFAWALLRIAGIKDSGMLLSLLDLASLGTIADVVPLTHENRILAIQGLQSLSSRSRLGLRHLGEVARIRGNVTARLVNFVLAPRINAAGRLEHASLAVELLLAKNAENARDVAKRLDSINSERQGIGSSIQEEVFSGLRGKALDDSLIVVKGNGWHPGVVGIVASKVVDAFYKPAVLIGVEDGMGRGSARSTDGINIFDILSKCREFFTDFGGHEFAAGFKIESGKINEFANKLKDEAKKAIREDDLLPRIAVDAEIGSSDITMGLLKELETLSPHGKGNPEPTFMTRNLKLVDWRCVGDGSHLKAKFTDGKVNLDVIGFGLGEMSRDLDYSSSYDIAYALRVSEWEGFESAELRLVDLKKS